MAAMSDEFGVWGATTPAAAAGESLRDAIECEVAIIGAGYTGLSTALHLAERGASRFPEPRQRNSDAQPGE